jgi:hypothetical protein
VGSAGTSAIEIEFAAETRMRITGTVGAAILKAAELADDSGDPHGIPPRRCLRDRE